MSNAASPPFSPIDTNLKKVSGLLNIRKRSLDDALESPTQPKARKISAARKVVEEPEQLQLKQRFFTASHFAVVGASDVETKWGYKVSLSLLAVSNLSVCVPEANEVDPISVVHEVSPGSLPGKRSHPCEQCRPHLSSYHSNA